MGTDGQIDFEIGGRSEEGPIALKFNLFQKWNAFHAGGTVSDDKLDAPNAEVIR